MNRKEWIEYFEAINNRKPTIQECQQALLNGEFVMEGKQATFSNNGKSVTEGAMPLPNQMNSQMVNPAYSLDFAEKTDGNEADRTAEGFAKMFGSYFPPEFSITEGNAWMSTLNNSVQYVSVILPGEKVAKLVKRMRAR